MRRGRRSAATIILRAIHGSHHSSEPSMHRGQRSAATIIHRAIHRDHRSTGDVDPRTPAGGIRAPGGMDVSASILGRRPGAGPYLATFR